MTLHTDMQAPLTEIARCRAMVVQGMTGAAVAERLGAAIAALEDVALRVLALEGGPVPPHWRRQYMPAGAPTDTGGVVVMFPPRSTGAMAPGVRP